MANFKTSISNKLHPTSTVALPHVQNDLSHFRFFTSSGVGGPRLSGSDHSRPRFEIPPSIQVKPILFTTLNFPPELLKVFSTRHSCLNEREPVEVKSQLATRTARTTAAVTPPATRSLQWRHLLLCYSSSFYSRFHRAERAPAQSGALRGSGPCCYSENVFETPFKFSTLALC